MHGQWSNDYGKQHTSPCFIWVGLASVGNDTVKHAAHYMCSTTRVPFVSFRSVFFLAVDLDQLCGVENLESAQGE